MNVYESARVNFPHFTPQVRLCLRWTLFPSPRNHCAGPLFPSPRNHYVNYTWPAGAMTRPWVEKTKNGMINLWENAAPSLLSETHTTSGAAVQAPGGWRDKRSCGLRWHLRPREIKMPRLQYLLPSTDLYSQASIVSASWTSNHSCLYHRILCMAPQACTGLKTMFIFCRVTF